MLEQRHRMEIKRLEKEMQLEMQKQREQLNAELEEELQVELDVSAAISGDHRFVLCGYTGHDCSASCRHSLPRNVEIIINSKKPQN